ncbi:UPF0104 family protein [Kineosporia sp. J2-2]|uniref:UPF0104 family protein n=1 Tax=Kineosporia corallincola TaxID=2835133 RepID=A0ABS5TGE2_9ACTN|nr:YbhN family protein [Kineosporia corallincola]MBT0769928.1 UPF0104 family protein [Kineosporia corallincola]
MNAHARTAVLVLSVPMMIWLVVRAVTALGAGWSAAGHAVLGLEPAWLPVLTVLWWAGHCARAGQVTACLPGLSPGRALGLCLAGSAVANSLPLGGALSFGVSAAMIRSWGFSARATTSYFTLNQISTVLLRVLFGVACLGGFLAYGPQVALARGPVLVSAGVAVALLLVCGLLARGRHRGRVGTLVAALREDIGQALRASWGRLVLNGLGYMLLLGVLLHLCLIGLAVHEPFLLVLAVVGIERLVTTVPLTPGGAGAAELTLLTCLTAAGAEPGPALAGALLYRFFTFGLEIPVGAAVILGWRLRHRRLGCRLNAIAAPAREFS